MPASAYSCVPRCVYTSFLLGFHIRNRIFAQIQNFFAIRTQNFPDRIQFLPFSSRSYARFCLLMNTPSIRGLRIRNRIFAQIRNLFAFRTQNFPNQMQFLTFSGRSYANFCLLMCAKVRIYCKYMPSVRGLHIRNRIFAQIRNFSFVGCGPGAYIIIIIIIVIHTTFNIMQKQCPAETTKLSTQTMSRGACGSNSGSSGMFQKCENILNIEHTVLTLVMPSSVLIHRSNEK